VNDGAFHHVGGNPETGGFRTWDGVIDEVGIWTRILTTVEIASLYNGRTGASITSLMGTPGDSDGDGFSDGVEVGLGSDPTDAASKPTSERERTGAHAHPPRQGPEFSRMPSDPSGTARTSPRPSAPLVK
jgi:hypothetical protein